MGRAVVQVVMVATRRVVAGETMSASTSSMPRVTSEVDLAVCGTSKTESVEERISAAIWKPLTLVTLYTIFLRMWYNKFMAEGQGNSSIFSDVWLACPIGFSLGYLALIWSLKKYMKDRAPLKIKNHMLTYNMYQTFLNAWCVVAFIKEVYTQPGMTVWGNKYEHSTRSFNMGFLIWVHYNNKYIELLDTVFMALRKKNEQISFLHAYHHVLLIWAWFAVMRLEPGGDCYFGALCNSFVHVLMYSYYGMALLKVTIPWKRQLTNIQMVQFVVCLSHAIYAIVKGNVRPDLAMIQVWVMTNMLVLFGHFYRNKYLKKAAAAKKTDAVTADAADEPSKSETERVLLKMKPVPEEKLPAGHIEQEPSKHMLAYREMQEKLHREGYYNRTLFNEFTTAFPVFFLYALGFYIAKTYPVVASLVIGLATQQGGWLAHDYVHGRGRYCEIMGRFVGGWICGFSRSWWSDKHNTHHCFTNCVDIDGDINNHPVLFNYPPTQEGDQWNRAYQYLYWPLVYPLLYASWRINSIKFLWGRGDYKELVFELLPGYFLLAMLPLPVAVGSVLAGGSMVAFVVTLSHESEELHFGEPEEFIKAQFSGTRDIVCPNAFMNWFFGGMQYQLEHHLFPTLPRVHYPWLAGEVESFAQKLQLDYKASPLWEFLTIHQQTLHKNAVAPAKQC